MKIGVLALQGAFLEHREKLRQLGVESFEIRQRKDLEQPCQGVILPGGESTVMGKLLNELDIMEPLRQKILSGLPVFGTCAGLLLLAKRIHNDNRRHLATMDITAKRNAYGRQLGSFHTVAPWEGAGEVPMTFIRAPYIMEVGPEAKVMAQVGGRIVAARQQRQLAVAFHPELCKSLFVHQYFLEMASHLR